MSNPVEAAATTTAIEVMLAHQFTTEDLGEPVVLLAFTACTCTRWSRQCGTVEGAETFREAHAEHVVEVLREAGLLAEDTPVVDGTCVMTHEEPYDFATCETHDTTFALGAECKFNGREVWEVFAEEADEQRGLKVRAEMEAEESAIALDVLRATIKQVIAEHPVSTAVFVEKVRPLLDPETDIVREAQRAAWEFGHQACVRGLGEDTNPF